MGRLFREDVHAALQDVPVEHLGELAEMLDQLAAALRHRAGDVNHLRRRLLREDSAEPGVPDPDEGAPA